MIEDLKNNPESPIVQILAHLGFKYEAMLPRVAHGDYAYTLRDGQDLGQSGENSYTALFTVIIVTPKDNRPEYVSMVRSTLREHTHEDIYGKNILSREYWWCESPIPNREQLIEFSKVQINLLEKIKNDQELGKIHGLRKNR